MARPPFSTPSVLLTLHLSSVFFLEHSSHTHAPAAQPPVRAYPRAAIAPHDMQGLKEIAVSSGSACTSASLEPSYVLRALGVDDELAHTSLRFGIGCACALSRVGSEPEGGSR